MKTMLLVDTDRIDLDALEAQMSRREPFFRAGISWAGGEPGIEPVTIRVPVRSCRFVSHAPAGRGTGR